MAKADQPISLAERMEAKREALSGMACAGQPGATILALRELAVLLDENWDALIAAARSIEETARSPGEVTGNHQCFTVSSTSYLRNWDPSEPCLAVHYQRPPEKVERGTSIGLCFPFLIMSGYVKEQQAVAKRVARILNAHWDGEPAPFQRRVGDWMTRCFAPEIIIDKLERNDRFIEEALELVQACGYSADRAHALVDYVFGRPAGDPMQEVGGVMVTLAALCNPHWLDMAASGERELERILQPEVIEQIRAKQASKPVGSALPGPDASTVT